MKAMLKRCLREVTPPIAQRYAQLLAGKLRLLDPRKRAQTFGVGETAEQADEHYRTLIDFFQTHYTDSPYYTLWCVVADRLMRRLELPILEIGCGAGQFASLLRDKGIESYSGIDFSAEALAIAKASCPSYTFQVADVYRSNILETLNYNTVVTLEVLEHIQEDVEVLKRIRPGTRVLASVPSFPGRFHVRHFSGCGEVAARYAELFEDFRVDTLGHSGNPAWIFLFEGVRRQNS